MLTHLRIKNLALVEDLRVDFQTGLNVITGETGAGKSILIGALSLLLGERADKKLIRTGEDACTAEAVFELEDSAPLAAILEELGLDPLEDNSLIIRRVLKASGANQQTLNDSPVTLQALKRVGDVLVDMHGPHDHQSLFSRAAQLELLDAYGHVEKEKTAYRERYDAWRSLEERREALKENGEDVETVIDVLRYRVKEIEEVDPRAAEEEEITQEHLTVSNAQRIMELGSGITSGLTEDEQSAFDVLASVQRMLEELEDMLPEAKGWREEAKSAAVTIQELSRNVASHLEAIEANPSRLAWLESRLAAYQKLKRKYGGSVESALKVLEESRRKLDDLESRGERLVELDKAIARTRQEVTKAGVVLRGKRSKAADKLAKAVTAELRDLGFEHGAFSIALEEDEPRTSGMDAAEFGFAPNLGEAMKPLREIASSGEISRVMLATKAVLAEHDRIPLLVFDEVDANVGGEMGKAIGRKLARLADGHQVVCITHLPQVAACGTSHYAVRKQVRDKRTVSTVAVLDEDQRVDEIARMLGGNERSEVTVKHAREMLEKI